MCTIFSWMLATYSRMLSTGLPDQTISTAGAISLGAKEYLEFSLCRAPGIGFPDWTSSPAGEGELRKENSVFLWLDWTTWYSEN